MIYTYRCNVCGRDEEQSRKLAERDEERDCNGYLWKAGEGIQAFACKGIMQRDGVELTARMPEQWARGK